MAPFIFDCPCCRETFAIDVAMQYTPPKGVSKKDWKIFLKIAEKSRKEVVPSEKFKQWQKAMA